MVITVTLRRPILASQSKLTPALKLALETTTQALERATAAELERKCSELADTYTLKLANAVCMFARELEGAAAGVEIKLSTDNAPVSPRQSDAPHGKKIRRRAGLYALPAVREHMMTMPAPFTMRRLADSAPRELADVLDGNAWSRLIEQLLRCGYLRKAGWSESRPGGKQLLLYDRVPGKEYPFMHSPSNKRTLAEVTGEVSHDHDDE